MSSDSPQDPSDPTPPLRPPTTASSFSGDAQSPFESSPFQKGSNIVDGGPTATFSLLHVFFWMAGISIALSINNGNVMTPDMQGPMKAWMESYMAAIRIISGIGMGPLIGMLPFWYIYRRRGIQFPYHPGHWMMMHYGSSFLINAICPR